MLTDHSVTYPMICFTLLRFKGSCDTDLWKQAALVALKKHPLLSSHVIDRGKQYPTWRCRYLWEPVENLVADDFFTSLGTISGGQPGELHRYSTELEPIPACSDQTTESVRFGTLHTNCPVTGIDLFKETAIRITHWEQVDSEGNRETHLLVHLHHAACDGIGKYQFLRDLLTALDALWRGEIIPPAPADATEKLKKRFWCGMTFLQYLKRLPGDLFFMTRTLFFLHNKAIPLPPVPESFPIPERRVSGEERNAQAPPEGFPALISREFSAKATAQMVQAARQQKGTLNDLFLYATYRAMQNFWQSEWDKLLQGQTDATESATYREQQMRKGVLRIAVPTNLRWGDCRSFSAANIVSMVFLDRKPDEIAENRRFFRKLAQEMNHIKRYHLGFAFFQSLVSGRAVFGGLGRYCHTNRCWTTLTLTNLGRVLEDVPLSRQDGELQVAGMTLQQIQSVPPIRRNTPLGIGAVTYNKRLTLVISYDRNVMTPEQANSFFDFITNALDRFSQTVIR